ncbi:MAG TPA: assimilatory sulfite reductase (NADPH) flavoprotein subunit [Gammaproteobacteria bacterium]|nr:assimilatory sulfite reductase (NADPH) flavoprotein subunit [Gammaproteobacteria bacterium]
MSSQLAPIPDVLPADKYRQLTDLTADLDARALLWVSGYAAGLAAEAGMSATANDAGSAVEQTLTVLYGSQTGNARRVAEQLTQQLEDAGLAVRLARADSYPVRELKRERLLYVVISTHSSEDAVEPPDDSRDFFELLMGKRAPRLSGLRYAVLGLGDSSYADFCGIGRQIDMRFAELGAQRVLDRADADVDIDSVARPWADIALDRAREWLEQHEHMPRLATVTPLRRPAPTWSRESPFAAEVLTNQRIVARDSAKDVRHIELLLEGSGLDYEPGDSLGVRPTQDPALVDAVLDALRLPGDAETAFAGEALPLSRWLGERRELTTLTRPFIAAHAERGGHSALAALLAPESRAALGDLLKRMQLIDLLHKYPADWNAESLVSALRPLAPRSYSIASSRKLVEDEVHLTVAHVRFGERWGAASHYLAGLSAGECAPVFIEPNERFRLPEDADRDIIMIGPGTGVAPFRAFVQERAAVGATGRNWLFFGNPHRRTDFLYQLEWQQARKRGELTRLDVAFSRDQADKIYVQHRMREHGRELYDWIENGAHVYVCGDANRMAGDVETALADIAAEHGGRDADSASTWLNDLRTRGRYARDVY